MLSDEEAHSIFAEMRAVREAEVELAREEEAAILEVLTVPQLVRFYAIREDLAQRVLRLRQGAGVGRRGGGEGGGDPGDPAER